MNILSNQIDYEIKNNHCQYVPLYQTYNNMHEIYDWQFLFDEVNYCFDAMNISNLKLKNCWANISTPESTYGLHSHTKEGVNISVVYYLENPSKNYGTLIKDEDTEVIICAPQNSLLIFDSKVVHSVVSPPPEISKSNKRCSIAMGFYFTDN